jgi:hypothetical protein
MAEENKERRLSTNDQANVIRSGLVAYSRKFLYAYERSQRLRDAYERFRRLRDTPQSWNIAYHDAVADITDLSSASPGFLGPNVFDANIAGPLVEMALSCKLLVCLFLQQDEIRYLAGVCKNNYCDLGAVLVCRMTNCPCSTKFSKLSTSFEKSRVVIFNPDTRRATIRPQGWRKCGRCYKLGCALFAWHWFKRRICGQLSCPACSGDEFCCIKALISILSSTATMVLFSNKN